MVRNNLLRRPLKRSVSLLLLIVFLSSLIPPLAVIGPIRTAEAAPLLSALDICHAGEASFSVKADSPLFFEFPPVSLIMDDGQMESASYSLPVVAQLSSQIDLPPKI